MKVKEVFLSNIGKCLPNRFTESNLLRIYFIIHCKDKVLIK